MLPELSPAKRALLEARQKGRHRPAALVRRAHEGDIPLSFAQERLYFLHRMQQESAAYHIFQGLRLAGDVDAALLERALGEVVRRHESLRTVFRETDGVPVQVVSPFTGFELPVEDLSGLPDEVREEVARARAGAEAARPFDLGTGPLFRAALLRLGAGENLLLLCMHHIVSDGWSMPVLYREALAVYAAYREGRPSPLPELPIQYADFAVWQREQARGGILERQLGYWKGQLAAAPELLELPTDHPRPPVPSGRGAALAFELPSALLERLGALGRAENATLFMVLLGAFQLLLARYSGSNDVVVGSPIAGRMRGETQGLIGFFVNTLVLRTDLGGDPSFRGLLGRVREMVLGAYENQDLPFERLVAELQPERSLSHSPLFQVMFTLQTENASAGGASDVSVGQLEADHSTAKFDLMLVLSASGAGLQGALEYSTDLFEPDTIQGMAGHMEQLLEQVAADPDVRLSRLGLMGTAERARVVGEWNRTDAEYPAELCIHDAFARQVERTPDGVALEWGDETLTYRALDARANQLAHRLQALGVGPDSRVGVLLERTLELVVCTLAVLKAGGCCVPVDTSYPPERMAIMLADSGARVLLTRAGLPEVPGELDLRVLYLDREDGAIAALPVHAPRSGAAPANLAYVFYTSGSTGRPKGVMMPHQQVVQLACAIDYMRMGPGERVAQASNASFDAAVYEVWGALLNGATLVGIDRDVLLSAPALAEALRERRIGVLYQTAALFNQHVREKVDVYAGLRELVFGAEAVGTESVRRMLRHGRPAHVLHEYGPTEATVWCTLEHVEEVPEDAPTVSIGRPIPNARMYVVDPALNPLPASVPGELYVGGDGVVRGYLGRPSLTAEKFVPDPFSGRPGARLYRTGDKVRWKTDGKLEFMGRMDDQVKIRGFRIEPGEVEGVIAAFPGVRGARVIVREDQPGDKRLVAYLVGDADAEALRAHVRQSLPEYMVPGAFVFMDVLPLTPNGKLDRRALPAPGYASAGAAYVAPRTPTEEVLAGIWAEVLRAERVGVEESFFALGGHSLLAMRVVSRIRDVFGVELPLRALFEGPTVTEMALRVESLRRAAASQLPPVVPVERDGPLPLSFAQERLWFLDRMQPGTATYNMPAALRLAGTLDAPALERALGEVVRRHEALRTVFADGDGGPVQTIAPFGGFTLPAEDLTALPGEAREAAARQRMADEAGRPFDLAAGPLFRAALLRLSADEHVLLLTLHHIVGDGWSMGVLFREMTALYAAFVQGGESPLAPLPVQYADAAVWQREQLQGPVLDGQLAYWKEQLAGAPEVLDLPTDRPRAAVQTQRGGMVSATLPPEMLERLNVVARAEGATLYMVLLAAFQGLLGRYSRSDDVVVGTPIAGRTRRETEGLIGLFVNTLVMRTDLAGDPAFRALVRRVRDVTLGAYEHQDVPFEQLVAELQPERSLSHSPLFQVMFTLNEGAGEGSTTLPGLTIQGTGEGTQLTKFELTLTCARSAAGLETILEYNAGLFDHATVERMLQHFGRLVEQVAADPERRLSEVELLTEAERDEVLDGWNGTERPYDLDRGIHQLVEAQAARTPDAVAVVHAGGRITYAALNGSANRLAGALRERGVGRGGFVPVLADRGPHVAVAMLAVMKTGAAFVPLDVKWPEERLRRVLEDLRAPVLLAGAGTDDLAPGLGIPVLAVQIGEGMDDADGAADVESGTGPDDPIYAIYTSGSTGVPKGAVVPHGGISNRFHWMTETFGADSARAVLQTTRHVYDSAVWQLFWPLATGGRTVLPRPDGETDADYLVELIHGEAVTMTDFVPSVFNALVPELAADASARERLASLRTIIVGGEQITAETTYRFMELFPGVGVVNLYGPTECSIGSIHHPVSAADGSRIPIGRPIANTSALILDRSGRLVPQGMPGEIHLGGRCVGLGYIGDGKRTSAVFIPNPYAPRGGERLYRTGDLGRYRADGSIECLGRLDEQVKIRGFRIEPGEVEAVLATHPDVREAAVAVREDPRGNRRLVAYVVGEADPEGLREHLLRTLPDYMVPTALLRLESLPRSAAGKLDRRALPAPEYAETEYVAPRTDAEMVMAEIWEEVLGQERVGVHDNFFALGGHSLMIMRLIGRVRSAFGVELSIRAVFAAPTLEAVAEEVERLVYEDILNMPDEDEEEVPAGQGAGAG